MNFAQSQFAAHPFPAPPPNLGWTPLRSNGGFNPPGESPSGFAASSLAPSKSPFRVHGSPAMAGQDPQRGFEETKELRHKLFEAEGAIVQLKRKIDELSVPAEGWRVKLEEKDKEIKNLRFTGQQAEFTSSTVKKDMQALKDAHAKALDSLRTELHTAKAELKRVQETESARTGSMDKALRDCQAKVAAQAEENTTLKANQSRLEGIVSKLRSEGDTASTDVAKLRRFEAAFWQIASAIQSAPRTARAPPEGEHDPLTGVLRDVKALISELAEKDEKIAQVTEAWTNAESREAELDSELRATQMTCSSLQAARAAEQKDAHNEIQMRENIFALQIFTAQNEIMSLRRQCATTSGAQPSVVVPITPASDAQLQDSSLVDELRAELVAARIAAEAQNEVVGSLKQELDDVQQQNATLRDCLTGADILSATQQTSICTLQARLMEERRAAEASLVESFDFLAPTDATTSTNPPVASGAIRAAIRDVHEAEVSHLEGKILHLLSVFRDISTGKDFCAPEDDDESEFAEVQDAKQRMRDLKHRVAALERKSMETIRSQQLEVQALRSASSKSPRKRKR